MLICLLLLLQLSQGCQCERQLVWPQCLQETLLDLRIQSQRAHVLTIWSSKLALVGTTAVDGKFALPTRVVQV